MIVQMRSRAQAEKVAATTGGVQLPGKPKCDGTPTLSARVDVGADFEAHRVAVEAVSVLFTLFDGFFGASFGLQSGVSPSRCSAGAARRSEWSGLSVDVLLDDRQGCACAGDREVRGRAEVSACGRGHRGR